MIVDSIITGKYPVGSVIVLRIEDLKINKSVFTHGVGLHEVIELMKALNFNYPKNLYVIAIEVKDFFTPSLELTKELQDKLEDIALNVLDRMLNVLNEIKE